MYKILTLNKISSIGTDCLCPDKYTIVNEEASPDGILLRSASMHEMELPESLKAVARAGAGVNNIPLDKCADQGIVVFNTPGANANAVKELVLCSIFLASRKIVQGINWTQSLNGQEGVAKLVEKGKGDFVGPEIKGKKLGVIGLGAIGTLVANDAVHLGMEVYAYNRTLNANVGLKLNPQIHLTDIETIVKTCDYISLHIALTPETKHMFNADTFNKVKKGVRILNFSRNELVDNEALKKALEDNTVSSYVIDFPTEDVLGVDNIITIPHLGASTPESEDNCAYMAATQIAEYLEKGNIVNSVNYPDCSMAYTGNKRICVLGKGLSVDNITSFVKEAGNTISAMVNASKGEYSYTIIDVSENEVKDMSGLKNIAGVTGYRVI